MRVLLAVIAVAGVLVACSESPTDPLAVSSAPSFVLEGSYCPAPFNQSSIFSGGGAEAADNNGDTVVCYLDVIDQQDATLVHRTWVDNNVPVQLGACPGNFDHSFITAGAGADRNADGVVCRATRPNGTMVEVDNRFAFEKQVEEPPTGEEGK